MPTAVNRKNALDTQLVFCATGEVSYHNINFKLFAIPGILTQLFVMLTLNRKYERFPLFCCLSSNIMTFVPNFCRNDELSCFFTNRFRAFYHICRKWPNLSQNFCYSNSLKFHESGKVLFTHRCRRQIITESVSKQPTQLIVQLNSLLRHTIVT